MPGVAQGGALADRTALFPPLAQAAVRVVSGTVPGSTGAGAAAAG